MAVGQWDQAVAHFRELCGHTPGYRDVEDKLAQALDASMALVPTGEFLLGSDAGDPDERPQRRVYLDAFEIDRYEVTNVQYRRFLLDTGRKPPQRWPERYVAFLPDRDPDWSGTDYPAGEAIYPAVAVNWQDAAAYCAWAGKRLPTEAEWGKQQEALMGEPTPGVTVGTKARPTSAQPALATPDQWAAIWTGLVLTTPWIWRAMLGSGWPICTIGNTTPTHRAAIRRGQSPVPASASCAVEPGTRHPAT